jgi:hypothetical protein
MERLYSLLAALRPIRSPNARYWLRQYAGVCIFWARLCLRHTAGGGGGYARLPAAIRRRTMLAMQYGISVL